ncbi:rRNA N6-adenosine-methyltransferase ZCCHC4-like isoform X2 [Biomphalaria glabrata]|uniref:rRNA N6-adenosine-methyltransferase ZCCHC4-like isoform X2 n=1 Tax=Biomphalaria glabrata TaxID=6526 RepID=A0A9W2ZS67_BIOGL|nr:rRNA N6-adenosine-methyltransferase ZCCHC4-like isoform X2 [Biomphalaria glabrata]
MVKVVKSRNKRTMAAKQLNMELFPLKENSQVPSCIHGPALLFERLDQSTKKARKFYACSAFRDRKECPFFQWVDEKIDHSSQSSTNISFSHRLLRKRYIEFKKQPRNNRHLCCTCGLLLLEDEVAKHQQEGHSLKQRIGLKELKSPSFLFTPLDNNKTFAQYLFSKSTVDFLLKTLEYLEFTHILCVGTPRIHEAIQNLKKSEHKIFSSMLLDLDERYAQFYPPALFTKYNMFNHHFFAPEGREKVSEFLKEGKDHVIMVTDPPFGGMVEALASSFTKLSSMWKEQADDGIKTHKGGGLLPTILFFPYFMEKRILEELPSLAMLDYKVDYDNHNLFNGQNKKKGSPVRIFTNISQVLFSLPLQDGYWFCEPCQRFSSHENWHCKDCGACTSKDGTKYVHCDACLRCVKPSRVHCFKCGTCQLIDHECGRKTAAGCHLCGELDHKRRDCPHRTDNYGEEILVNNRIRKRKKIFSPTISGKRHRMK